MSGAPPSPRSWSVEHLHAPAADLHARELPRPLSATAWVMRVRRPALALGSMQSMGHVDAERAARAGVDVVRRRSGGGAVLLAAEDPVWIDLILPSDDELWVDDVGRAAWWVGETWIRALVALGADPAGLDVHHGALQRSAWSDRICFGGLGAGEVTAAGRKVVGISQRRTRHGARLQCAALLRWEPDPLVDLLALDAADREACRAAVATAAVGVVDLVGDPGRRGPRRGQLRDLLEAAFLAALPS